MKRKTILETANVNNTTFKMHVTSSPNKKCHSRLIKKKKKILNKHL